MPTTLPLGEFTCPITFERVRPPRPIVKEEGGISYVVQGDYELAFQTVLRFGDASELPTSFHCSITAQNCSKSCSVGF